MTRRLSIAILLVAAVASCATEKDKGEPTLASPTTEQEATAASGEATTTEAERKTFEIGDRVETARGNFLTLHAYEQPVPPAPFLEPDPGQEYGAVDMEFCAVVEPLAGSMYRVNPGDWELVMADNTRRTFEMSAKEPALHHTEVAVGDCLRGWITYQVPQGERPAFLIDLTTDPPVRWRIG